MSNFCVCNYVFARRYSYLYDVTIHDIIIQNNIHEHCNVKDHIFSLSRKPIKLHSDSTVMSGRMFQLLLCGIETQHHWDVKIKLHSLSSLLVSNYDVIKAVISRTRHGKIQISILFFLTIRESCEFKFSCLKYFKGLLNS